MSEDEKQIEQPDGILKIFKGILEFKDNSRDKD